MNDLDLFGEPIPVASLGELAAAINAEHTAAERTARTAIEHARAAGECLLLAKAQVEHGQWLPWLSSNCPALSARTARAKVSAICAKRAWRFSVCATARARLLALPSRLAANCCQQNFDEIENRARAIVHEALNEISEYNPADYA